MSFVEHVNVTNHFYRNTFYFNEQIQLRRKRERFARYFWSIIRMSSTFALMHYKSLK